VASKCSWVFPGGMPATSTAQNPGNVTFGTPGQYTASLTVVDASGNSDASPPTRVVTVNPASPDFHISVSPSGTAVSPGQSTNFTVTVTPVSGFTGAVSLTVASEAPFPSGVTSGGFSPSTIPGQGSSTLTMNTTTAAVPYALSLTITGTSGSLTHTTSTTLMVTLAPPTSLSATPASGQVSLSWVASVGASGYQVKRSTLSGGPYTTVGCATGTSFVDTGLTNGTTYYYVVAGTYTGGPVAGGASANSSQVSATPQSAVPQAPGGLTATPGDAQVSLSWNPSSGATGYNVKRSTTSGGPYTTVGSPAGTSFTNTGLTNGTPYFYVVTAVNASGESANSAQVSATPRAAVPQAPGGLTATPGNTQVSLSWNSSSGATSYNVKRSTTSGGPYTTVGSPAGTSFTDTGLTNGTPYFYVVSAVNASGESGNSTQVTATPQSVAPAPPTGLTANPNKPRRLTLHWTQSVTPGVIQNGIYRRTQTGTYPPSPTIIPANTAYQDGSVTSGTTYCYVVTAISGAGMSAQSNESCARPK